MKNATHIVCIVDQSASMGSIREEAVAGYNKFIKEQKAHPGEASLQLVLFDYPGYVEAYKGKLADAPEMSLTESVNKVLFRPQGCTALLDATGRTMNNAGMWLADIPEHDRPDKVLCVILTDGEENSSSEFTHQKVAEMVAHQRDKYSWEFLFLGANIDSWSIAKMMGIGANHAVNFMADAKGIRQAFAVSNLAASGYRDGTRSVCSVVSSATDEATGYIDDAKLNQQTGGTSDSSSQT